MSELDLRKQTFLLERSTEDTQLDSVVLAVVAVVHAKTKTPSLTTAEVAHVDHAIALT